MNGQLYHVYNGPSAASVGPQAVATGASVRTMLQLVHPTNAINVVEWGISFSGSVAATPVVCELIQTGTTAATVTPYVANDVTQFTDPTANVPGITLSSVTGSGYTATAEGSVTAPVRQGDVQLVMPANQYLKQFPLGQEFVVPSTGILRVRVTAPATVGCFCYVVFSIG